MPNTVGCRPNAVMRGDVVAPPPAKNNNTILEKRKEKGRGQRRQSKGTRKLDGTGKGAEKQKRRERRG